LDLIYILSSFLFPLPTFATLALEVVLQPSIRFLRCHGTVGCNEPYKRTVNYANCWGIHNRSTSLMKIVLLTDMVTTDRLWMLKACKFNPYVVEKLRTMASFVLAPACGFIYLSNKVLFLIHILTPFLQISIHL
jgi:hypothetical protein